MSQRRVKTVVEGEVDGEKLGTGAWSEKSSSDEMKASEMNRRVN